MAADTSTSRRALLKVATGAAAYGAGITLVSVAGVAASAQMATAAKAATVAPDGGMWWRTFARMENANAACEKYNEDVYHPLYTAWLKANGGSHFHNTPERQALSDRMGLGLVEDHYEQLVDVYCDLQTSLLEMPAPDAKAARWKFDYLTGVGEDTGSTPSWSKEFATPIIADVRRFVGGEA